MKLHLLTVLMLTATLAAPGQGNLVFNGGFEDGAFDQNTSFPGRMLLSNGTQQLPGWTVSVGSGAFAYVWRMRTPNVAKEGGHMLSLDSNTAVPGSGVSQSLATVPGQEYLLSFWYSNEGMEGTSLTQVYINDRLLGSVTHQGSAPAGDVLDSLDWSQTSYAFTAHGAASTLRFLDATSGVHNTILDGISVVAVPEPGGLAMLVGGGMVVGLAHRAQRR
ncbi:MAG: DUF642 domain-containing protein [Limisphaerales bacterium]